MILLFQILILLSFLILLIGLIKPKWIMFWSDNPDRVMIMVIAAFMFMGSFTGYGEFLRREKEAESTPVFARTEPLPKPNSEEKDKEKEEQSAAAGPK
ncbi:MAG: hypothetical protein ABFS02_03280 [Pseudomonadota bacterium]